MSDQSVLTLKNRNSTVSEEEVSALKESLDAKKQAFKNEVDLKKQELADKAAKLDSELNDKREKLNSYQAKRQELQASLKALKNNKEALPAEKAKLAKVEEKIKKLQSDLGVRENNNKKLIKACKKELNKELKLMKAEFKKEFDPENNEYKLQVRKIQWEKKKFKRKFADKIMFDKWKAWLYLLPTLVLLAIFTFWPLINTVKMAFTVYWDPEAPIYQYDENGDIVTDDDTGKKVILGYGKYKGYNMGLDIAGETKFQFGISNFTEVLKYDGFLQIMKNTIILCVATVPISTFLALLIAVCLNAIKPLRRFLQTIFFMPYVTNSIAIGMVFAAMFNIVGVNEHELMLSKSLGIINNIIGVVGLGPVNWINQGSGYWANIAVMIIYIVWNALPFKILILLGGLQSVNKQYYEAAKVDATPAWRVFTRITVPLLSPMIAYVVITGFIGGFKEYTSIIGIFGDKMQPPGAATGTPRLQTMVGFIYEALETNSQGLASAAAIILFLLIFAVTLVNLYVSKKKTHY